MASRVPTPQAFTTTLASLVSPQSPAELSSLSDIDLTVSGLDG